MDSDVRAVGRMVVCVDVAARMSKRFLLHRITSATVDEENPLAW